MTPEKFTATLKAATPAQLESLDQAHWRYMSLIGIVSDVLPIDVVAADQMAYPQFIKRENDLPVFNDAECKTFMVAITGLSPEFCEAWKDKDYYELHSETVHETLLGRLVRSSR